MSTFEIVQRQEQPTAVVHENVAMTELPRFFERAYGQIMDTLRQQGLEPAGEPFAMYFGMPGQTVEVEAGFPVARSVKDSGTVHPGRLPAGRCAHATHVGPYDAMSETYSALQEWMSEKQLTPDRTMWEVYLSDPRLEPDPSKWRTEIYWPVH